jgi:hypothetical protein
LCVVKRQATKSKRLIDANALKVKGFADPETGEGIIYVQDIDEAPTVDAVEVVKIEEAKQEILQQMDMFIAEYTRIGFYGKSDAMEIARRLVNAALTDLAKMDGERKDNGTSQN